MNSSMAPDRFTTGAEDAVIVPRYRVARPPVVYLHGLYGTAAQPFLLEAPGVLNTLRALVNQGHTVVIPWVEAFWDNADGEARVDDALTYARSELGCTNDPAIFVGTSHGGGSALHYAAEHPDRVACIVGIVPAIDWEHLRTIDYIGISRYALDTSWGVTFPDPLPPGVNPAERPAAVVNTPMQLWVASDDVVSYGYAAFDAVLPLCEVHVVGATGHSEISIAAVNAAQVVAFVQANSA
jgi:pimeloyl-ACP methyl ester carboxylesterase